MPRGVPAQLTGQRFGRWTVQSRAENYRSGQVRWHCLCDCGHQTSVSTTNLVGGKSKGCRSCANRVKGRARRKKEGEA